MAGNTAILSVRVTGQSRRAEKALKDTAKATKNLESSLDRVQGSMDRFSEGFEALENIEPLITGIETIITESNKLHQEMTRTEFLLGQVDGAASGAAGKLGAYAEKYGDLVGASEASVREVQNTILAFEGVRDTMGDSTETVERATKAAHDFAAVMGTDATKAAEDIGTALDDPIDGLEDLEDAGAKFSDSQKEMIKNLIDSGDKLGAQNVILEDLEDTFGGAAESTRSSFDRIGGTLTDFAAEIGDTVEPVLNLFADWLEEHEELLVPFTAGVTAATTAVVAFNSALLVNPITAVIIAIGALTAAVVYAYQEYDEFRAVVDNALTQIWEVTQRVWEEYLKPIYDELSAEIKETLIPAFWDFWHTVEDTLGYISEETGITWEDIKDFADDVEEWFEEKLPDAVDFLGTNWKTNFKLVGYWVQWAGMMISFWFNSITTTIKFLEPVIDLLVGWWLHNYRIARDSFNWIWDKTKWWRNLMKRAFDSVIDSIRDLIDWLNSIPVVEDVVPSSLPSPSGTRMRAFGAGLGTLDAPTRRTTLRLPDPGETVVQVFLEGKEIRNAVRRVVERAIEDEGGRLQAGAAF